MPTRFQFDLSPVLQLRERAVDAAREALGQAVHARAEAEGAENRARAALADGLAADGLAADGPTRTAAQFGASSAHRRDLARAVGTAGRTAARLQAEEHGARRALAAALREQEALATLRAEAAADHQARALRLETAALDDLATAGRAARTRTHPTYS